MKMTTDIRRVWMDPAAHEKLWAWTRMAKGEVSMLGLVDEVEDQPFITDLFLVKQTCTPASTDMDQDAVAKLMVELAADGRSDQLRAWVHSHGTMNVFWSNQDDSTIEDLAGDPYLVSVVVNRKGEVRARVDVFRPVRVTVDEVPVEVLVPSMGLEPHCAKEFREKVKEESLAGPMTLGRPLVNTMPWRYNNKDQPDLFSHHDDLVPGLYTPQELEEMARSGEISYEDFLAGMAEWDEFEDEQGGNHGAETTV